MKSSKSKKVSRREFLKSVAVATGALAAGPLLAACAPAAVPTPTPTTAKPTPVAVAPTPTPTTAPPTATPTPKIGPVTILSKGGSYQEAQRKAYFQPFEKETGIKVIEAEGVDLAKIKAMVESKNVEVDVIDADASLLYALKKANLVEKIDPSKIDKADLDSVDPKMLDPYAVPHIVYSAILCYRTDVFPTGKHPKSWAEVWDVKKFPGKRTFPSGERGSLPPLEFALLADGIPVDKLYPIDIDRAFKKIDEIKKDIVWAHTSAQLMQFYVDKEAVVGQGWDGRVGALKKQGAPLEIEWNQGRLMLDYFVIPKGAKNYEGAMRFLAYIAKGKPQADLVKIIPYGPTNKRAYDYIDAAVARTLTSYPDNVKNQFIYDAVWWGENLQKVVEKWNEWKLR
ncbi:MAG: ABC transporter substrate-binding protein [Chloroflexi bacterium]|nr:ABC transporter substrate-binding protein [Chloroflexota bacterium]MCL5075408.1 ABC transporter substrate-binding protein [Chloroflexota bacterium]